MKARLHEPVDIFVFPMKTQQALSRTADVVPLDVQNLLLCIKSFDQLKESSSKLGIKPRAAGLEMFMLFAPLQNLRSAGS